MSRGKAFPKGLCVRLAKTQISLHICTVIWRLFFKCLTLSRSTWKCVCIKNINKALIRRKMISRRKMIPGIIFLTLRTKNSTRINFRTLRKKNHTGFSEFRIPVATENDTSTKYMEIAYWFFSSHIPNDFLTRFHFYIWRIKTIWIWQCKHLLLALCSLLPSWARLSCDKADTPYLGTGSVWSDDYEYNPVKKGLRMRTWF